MMKAKGVISEVFGSFQGEGPFLGERHVFIRFSGCALGCEYCDTPYALQPADEAYMETGPGKAAASHKNPVSVQTVLDAVFAQEIFPGFNSKISITGGEPLEQPEFLRGLLEGLHGRFGVLLETNGIMADALKEIVDLVDVISMDFKGRSTAGKGDLWAMHREFLEVAKARTLIAKIVVSADTPGAEVEAAADILREKAPASLLVIQPISTSGRFAAPGPEKLLELYGAARRILENVRVIPQVHKIMGVR